LIELIKIELFKIFSKWRTYIGFIALAILFPLIHSAMYVEGKTFIELFTKNLTQSFNLQGNLLNGYMVSRIILQSLFVQIPLLISLVGGDLLAGEATSGTYRLLLIRPITRSQIIWSKFIAGTIYTMLMIIWIAFLSLGLGILIFGTGDMIVVVHEITIIPEADVLWRYFYTFIFAFMAMWTVFTLSFFFSALVENSIGPIISTMAIIIVFSLINLLSVGFLEQINPLLFTQYLTSWRYFFDVPVDMENIKMSVYVMLGHVVVLFSVAYFIFIKKDIQS